MEDSVLLSDYFRLIITIVLPSVIWSTKNCAGFSGKTQLLYAISYTSSCIFSWFTYPSKTETEIKSICALATWITVYLMYKYGFKDISRHEDSFRIEYLILIAAILALLFNGFSIDDLKCTYSEQLQYRFNNLGIKTFRSFGLFLEGAAIIPQLSMCYQNKTDEIKSAVLNYINVIMWYQFFYWMEMEVRSMIYRLALMSDFLRLFAWLQIIIFMICYTVSMGKWRRERSADETTISEHTSEFDKMLKKQIV